MLSKILNKKQVKFILQYIVVHEFSGFDVNLFIAVIQGSTATYRERLNSSLL